MRTESFYSFIKECHELYMVLHFSSTGLTKQVDEFKKLFKQQRQVRSNPNPKLFLGPGHPSEGNHVASIPIKELIEKSKKNNDFHDLLSKQIIVFIFAIWDEKYRIRLAEEFKTDKNNILCDIMGDIRILRNAIAHANSKLEPKRYNQLKLIKEYFSIGEFTLSQEFMSNLMKHINEAEFRVVSQ